VSKAGGGEIPSRLMISGRISPRGGTEDEEEARGIMPGSLTEARAEAGRGLREGGVGGEISLESDTDKPDEPEEGGKGQTNGGGKGKAGIRDRNEGAKSCSGFNGVERDSSAAQGEGTMDVAATRESVPSERGGREVEVASFKTGGDDTTRFEEEDEETGFVVEPERDTEIRVGDW